MELVTKYSINTFEFCQIYEDILELHAFSLSALGLTKLVHSEVIKPSLQAEGNPHAPEAYLIAFSSMSPSLDAGAASLFGFVY